MEKLTLKILKAEAVAFCEDMSKKKSQVTYWGN